MIFELILTDSCNRNCNFCQIKKNNYFISEKEIIKFCDYVNNYNGKRIVNLFGGEPLLNKDGIRTCLNKLKLSTKINLYTNGDNLKKEDIYLNRTNIQVTAYDIFDNSEKYSEMCKNFKNISFTFTFDQDTIFLTEDFKEICKHELNNKFKIALSHSNNSWDKIENDNLYNLIREITHNEIIYGINNKKLSKFIEPKVKRIYELKNNPNVKRVNCLSEGKMTFYKGEFLKVPCILYSNSDSCPNHYHHKCKKCIYDKICTKSCSFETINGEVPEKLCIIEKAQFDEIDSFFV